MTNSRTHRTQGKPRARERIAAERAARKRAEARRRLDQASPGQVATPLRQVPAGARR